MKYKLGTILTWNSGGNTYYGFVIGTCSYDVSWVDNAYVMRYVSKEYGLLPGHPYAVVDMNAVSPVDSWPDDFIVDGHFSATPPDRVDEWEVSQDKESGLFIVYAVNSVGKIVEDV